MRKKLTIFSFLILCFSTIFFAACNEPPVNTKFMIKVLCGSDELISEEHEITEDIDYELLAQTNGYNVDGIYMDPEYSLEFAEGTVVEAGSTLYIKVSPINYSITYEIEGYEVSDFNVINPTSYNVTNEKIVLKNPIDGRSNFTGWKDENGHIITEINPSDMKNYKLKGGWDYSMFNVNQKTGILTFNGISEYQELSGELTPEEIQLQQEAKRQYERRCDIVEKYDVLVFPEKKGATIVTSIGGNAFVARNKKSTLKQVYLPQTIVSLEAQAFAQCVSLEKISIPDRMKNIPYATFDGCVSLKSVILPEGLETIDINAFDNTGITKLYIPESVNYIAVNPFVGCNNLTEIIVNPNNKTYRSEGNAIIKDATLIVACKTTVIPESVTIIGERAFSGVSFDKALVLNKNIVEIKDSAFMDSNISEITFSENLTKLGESAFANCKNLTNVSIPNGVTILPDFVFSTCIKLTTITLPENLVSIGMGAFRKCSLTSITLPTTLQTIGAIAFTSNFNLTEIIIPENVKEIGDNAFLDSTNLVNVYIDSVNFAKNFVVETLLDNPFHFAHTIQNVYVKSNIIEVSADLQNTELFEKVESDKVSYNKYIKK